MAPNASECPVTRSQVETAVMNLKKSEAVLIETKRTILDDHKKIDLIITLHKIPSYRKKRIFLQLPHSLFKNADVCFITKDKDKKDTDNTIEHYEALLRKQNVTSISEILPITKLKLDYKSYEAKRRLCDLYDLFLCESSILHRMPALTGKYFLNHRKVPRGFQLPASEKVLKARVDKALSTTEWYFSGYGACSSMTFAKTTFSVADIVENLMSALSGVAKFVPRGWENVKSLFIKTTASAAVPVYVNDVCDVICEKYEEREVEFLKREKKRRSAPNLLLYESGIRIMRKRQKPVDDEVCFDDRNSRLSGDTSKEKTTNERSKNHTTGKRKKKIVKNKADAIINTKVKTAK